jgi:hypothetical protein
MAKLRVRVIDVMAATAISKSFAIAKALFRIVRIDNDYFVDGTRVTSRWNFVGPVLAKVAASLIARNAHRPIVAD